MTTTTPTINDQLVELGVLGNQKDKSIQRAGAEMIEAFFDTYQEGDNVDDATVSQLLHYLTDIQVRDYALGLLGNGKNILSALNYLLDKAPTDTTFINAPACLLAALLYERGDSASAVITLSNAQHHYSLAILLKRVMQAGWPPTSFTSLRADLHPKVVAGIFGVEDDQA